jgi:isoleucyl-tRNA synthetase
VPDPAIMVSFPLKDEIIGGALVAWTTTPWTLPSNLALCVNATFDYVKVCKDELVFANRSLSDCRYD